jgi:DNA-binding MarR family transcriptional regulator
MSSSEVLDSFIALRRHVALIRASEASALDFGHNQIAILYKLSLGPATMGALADYTLSDKASISRTVNLLEDSGFIKRVSDPSDRRVTSIELTAKGRAQSEKAVEIRKSIAKKLDSTLTTAERKQLSALVNKVVANDKR